MTLFNATKHKASKHWCSLLMPDSLHNYDWINNHLRGFYQFLHEACDPGHFLPYRSSKSLKIDYTLAFIHSRFGEAKIPALCTYIYDDSGDPQAVDLIESLTASHSFNSEDCYVEYIASHTACITHASC